MLVDCIQLAISHPISVDDHLLWQSLLLLVECTQAGWKCPTQLPPSPATKYYIQLKQPRNLRGYTFIFFLLIFFLQLIHMAMCQKWCRTDWSLHHQLLKSDQSTLVNTTKKDWWYSSRVELFRSMSDVGFRHSHWLLELCRKRASDGCLQFYLGTNQAVKRT